MKFIEVTLLFPLTCLIMIALITLMLQFYQELSIQIATHDETRYQMFSPMESNWIRLQDRVQQGIEGEGQEEID